MTISQEQLQKYSDFVSLNSTGGVYDPQEGLEALLSSLTPDPKVIVLRAMAANRNEWFFSDYYLHKAVLEELSRLGLNRGAYPISRRSSWHYCERLNEQGDLSDGSLISVGAVVKQANMSTPQGLKIGYQISLAGYELALPLGKCAIDFVWSAMHGSFMHRYDSMWKLLGTVSSTTESRKQAAVFHVLQYLVEHPGLHGIIDIYEGLEGSISLLRVSRTVNALGICGVIDHQSLEKTREGRIPKGLVTFELSPQYRSNPMTLSSDGVCSKIQDANIPFRYWKALEKILDYIRTKPLAHYDKYTLGGLLELHHGNAQIVINTLENIGILVSTHEFQPGEVISRAGANDLSRMFRDMVIIPAWQTASTLSPTGSVEVEPERVKFFSNNYSEERTIVGPEGGKEVRGAILDALTAHDEMKLYQIIQIAGENISRKLNREAFAKQLRELMKRGLVKKTKKDYYTLS